MTVEDEQLRSVIQRLHRALRQPEAFQQLVDRLPHDHAILGLKIWGALRGLYLNSPATRDDAE
jgi:hypothetical protein